MPLRAALAVAALIAVPSAAPAARATVPPGFADELVARLPVPTAIAFTPDGRMLVTTQRGQLRVIRGGTVVAAPALDLTERVCSDSERGLLGVAVDPGFPARPFVYLYYTFRKHPDCGRRSDRVPVNRVSRFTLAGDTVDSATERVLIDEIPSFNGNHNGGDVQFGKDGHLYVTVGDGGCDYAGGGCAGANDAARDRHALLGKVLRVTVDGGIPPDNPWQGPASVRCAAVGVAEPGKECAETFAWGLRNPFRLGFDPNAAGVRFFINDVGQNAWEEVDLGEAGADYGWNVREGPCVTGSRTECGPPPAGLTNPVFAYGHGDGCFSITGGAFVPRDAWPAPYSGAYLLADLGCGIFRLEETANGYERRAFLPDVQDVVHLAFGPSRGGQALYYTTYANGGEVRRIGRAAAQRAAVQSFRVTGAARPGRRVVARLEVAGVGGGTPAATCTGRIGAKPAAATRSQRRAAGIIAVTCSWRIPARTAGQTLRATVRVVVDGATLSRSFARVIRR